MTPEEVRDAQALVSVAVTVSAHGTNAGLMDFEAWYTAIEKADPRTVIAAMSGLGTTGVAGSRYDSLRDAARSMVELNLTNRMIAKMERLERASSRLGWFGIAVALIVAVVGPVLQWWLGSTWGGR